jgi:hypothetical protein
MGRGSALRIRHDRSGSVLAVVAVSLLGLVGAVALAVDLGMLYAARGEAQRAADSAALAGASAFLDFDPEAKPVEASQEAEARALDYATRHSVMNGQILAVEVTPEILLNEQKVRVTIRRTAVPLFFARVFGMQSSGVAASAAAEVVQAGSTTCVKPFAIPDVFNYADPETDIYRRENAAPVWDFDAHLRPNDDVECSRNSCTPEAWDFATATYDPEWGYGSKARNGAPDYEYNVYDKDIGRRVPLKLNDPSDQQSPASFWFPWRLPGSAGNNDLIEAIKGCVSEVDVGETVETETGNTPKTIFDAMMELVNADPDAYWDQENEVVVSGSHPENWRASPRVIKVALFNPEDIAHGMNQMRFVNMATFFLEDPTKIYPGVNPPFMAPITGRLVSFTSGSAGPETGSLVKRLRLVE